jgi:hypothetical protein
MSLVNGRFTSAFDRSKARSTHRNGDGWAMPARSYAGTAQTMAPGQYQTSTKPVRVPVLGRHLEGERFDHVR